MIKSISIALAIAAALAAAGCGGGSDSNGSGEGGAYGGGESTGASREAKSETTAPAVVSVAGVPEAGKVLVDSKGFTLYYFEKDKGGRSACYGACAGVWPPLSGTPKAQGGAVASKFGTTERKDGTTQVTYAGWPLYTYAGDKEPGEDKGTDLKSFGATWYPLHPDGEKAGE